MNGRLFIEFSTANLTPLPIAVNSMCKFKLRARPAAVLGSHAMIQGDSYNCDYMGNYLRNFVMVENAAVRITPERNLFAV